VNNQKANQLAIEELEKNLKQGDTCALVGAGMSVSSGYPSWSKLLEMMKQKAVKGLFRMAPPKTIARVSRQPDILLDSSQIQLVGSSSNSNINSDALWQAELYKQYFHEGEYPKFLQDLFQPIEMTKEAQQKLLSVAGLGFRHIFTTNYDNSMEWAFKETKPDYRVLDWNKREDSSEFLAASKRKSHSYYVYLHGRYTNPGEIILTESDYLRRYYYSDEAKLTLFSVFMSHPIVFIGFSLSDPEITHLLRITRGFTRSSNFQHYAILPLVSLSDEFITRKYLNDKYGINPIFYDVVLNANGEQDHSDLFRVIEQIEIVSRGNTSTVRVIRDREEVAIGSNSDPFELMLKPGVEFNMDRIVKDKQMEEVNGNPIETDAPKLIDNTSVQGTVGNILGGIGSLNTELIAQNLLQSNERAIVPSKSTRSGNVRAPNPRLVTRTTQARTVKSSNKLNLVKKIKIDPDDPQKGEWGVPLEHMG
jgi:hypothetical protein